MAGFNSLLVLSLCVFAYCDATCPGVPGYCSESHPGQTCVVVCERGRPNVPLCQADGTWTAPPRCIEHDPGKEAQLPGLCPGVSGYCSDAYTGERCKFPCSVGDNIDSVCTADGTWFPFPTCVDDVRETQDGCNPCHGPLGKPRNRPLEALLGLGPKKPAAPKSVFPNPSAIAGKKVPTFAGQLSFGQTQPQQPAAAPATISKPAQSSFFQPAPAQPRRQQPAFAPQQQQQQAFRPQQQQQQQQQSFGFTPQQQANFLSRPHLQQQPRQQPLPAPRRVTPQQQPAFQVPQQPQQQPAFQVPQQAPPAPRRAPQPAPPAPSPVAAPAAVAGPGESRRVFNPQTGEYEQVQVSAAQVAKELKEQEEKSGPMPLFRGRFKVGADGKLTGQPLPEEQPARQQQPRQQELLIQNSIPGRRKNLQPAQPSDDFPVYDATIGAGGSAAPAVDDNQFGIFDVVNLG